MSNYTPDQVKSMLGEAFEEGNKSCCELRDEIVEEIIKRHQTGQPPADEQFRIYGIAELSQLPEGTVMEHQSLGKGFVKVKQGMKYFEFENTGYEPSGFKEDSYPWDEGMRRIS